MEIKRFYLNRIYPVLLVALVAFISIASLAITENALRADLDLRQYQETMGLIRQIFSEADSYTYDIDTEIYTVYQGHSRVGYTFYGKDYGYRGKIIVFVGIKDAETMQGVVVIDQSEDYQYWAKLEEANFLDKFVDLEIEECHPSYSWLPGGVDVVSGASTSCMGVVRAARKAAEAKIEYIQ